MSKVFIIIVVIAIIIGGFFIFRGEAPVAEENQEISTDTVSPKLDGAPIDDTSAKMETGTIGETAGNPEETAKTLVVTYTNNGFSPKTITIKKGDSVTFINQSSGGMWVASDAHPSHTAYSGTSRADHCPDESNTSFDECKSVSAGESWSFTFDKVGSWNYHNHVNPSNIGTVVVE